MITEGFPSVGEFASWVACTGSDVSAEENPRSRCNKENRYVRRLLTEAAQGAVKKKGSHFQNVFRRFLPKLTYDGAIGVVAHRLAQLVWKILHDGISCIEQGQDTHPRSKKRRAQKLAQAVVKLGIASP
jgi:hypothetical protein